MRFQNLVTIGAKYMAVMDGHSITAADNLNVNLHPFWSQISILDVTSTGQQFDDLIWIDPAIWAMDQPQFTCLLPCNVMILPWTGATSTVNYPLLTVSAGTWTSTITMLPLTVSVWQFEVVTLTQGPGARDLDKRQAFADFWPKPLAAPLFWPSVTYTGPDMTTTVVGPTVPVPTFPASIGPNAPALPTGSWPARAVRPQAGAVQSPSVEKCIYLARYWCGDGDWGSGGNSWGPVADPDYDDFDENWEDVAVTCPAEPSTTSSLTLTPTPTETLKLADPMFNTVSCYDGGLRTENAKLVGGTTDMCNRIKNDGSVFTLPRSWSDSYILSISNGNLSAKIDIWVTLKEGCAWFFNFLECLRYAAVPIDSCNCATFDSKQGGIMENNCLIVRVDPNLTL